MIDIYLVTKHGYGIEVSVSEDNLAQLKQRLDDGDPIVEIQGDE